MVGGGGICKLAVFVDSVFANVLFFLCKLVFAALSQRSFPLRRFVRIKDAHFVTQLAAARHAACLQAAVQLPAVSARTADDDPWRALHK